MLSEPRNDFANGVRELATTTASLMGFLSVYTGFQMYEDYQPQRTQRTQRCHYSSVFSVRSAANHPYENRCKSLSGHKSAATLQPLDDWGRSLLRRACVKGRLWIVLDAQLN